MTDPSKDRPLDPRKGARDNPGRAPQEFPALPPSAGDHPGGAPDEIRQDPVPQEMPPGNPTEVPTPDEPEPDDPPRDR